MTRSNEPAPRRRRFTPVTPDRHVSLTPQRLQILQYVAECELLTTPQVIRLVGQGRSPQAVARDLRLLYDAGLLQRIAICRAALATDLDANDPSLLYGSAPLVCGATREGMKVLHRLGRLDRLRRPPDLGPRSSWYAGHFVAVQDLHVWLVRLARSLPECELLAWRHGKDADIDLKRADPPHRTRPDAWFHLRLGSGVLQGLAEVDMGTEGQRRFAEKLTGYAALFAGDRLLELTGRRRARVLAIAPTEKRRDQLAAWIMEGAAPELASRFWLADRTIFDHLSLAYPCWRRPGQQDLFALVPAEHSMEPRP